MVLSIRRTSVRTDAGTRIGRGRLRHDGGVVRDAPGMVALGLTFLRRRKSSFIHGAQDDARDPADHLASYLGAS